MTANWEAQTLRITLFPTETTAVSSEWWAEFSGTQPDNENRQPKDAIVVVTGTFEGKFLSIGSGVGRIDVVFQPLIAMQHVVPFSGQPLPQVTVGPADKLLDLMFSRIGPLCARAKAVERIALGGVFFRHVASKEAAYEELKRLLKSVAVQPERMRDLIYRVNWPIRDTAGRLVNRIGAWSAMTALIRAHVLTQDPAILSEDNYVTFECDINTAPENHVRFGPEDTRSELEFLRGALEENLRLGEVLT